MEDLHALATRLEDAIVRERLAIVRRVAVVRETGSTQDFAVMVAAGKPGVVVFAGRQTAGRGRLGRSWADTSHLGVAMTFVLNAAKFSPERLSIAAGVAACCVVEAAVGGAARVGIRWPNDVCERATDGPGRKLSGVLIEQRDGLALVGIGINVLQRRGDWDEALAARVTSLVELGSTWDRAAVAERLMVEFDQALRREPRELAAAWSARELLIGKRCTFRASGVEYSGVVEGVDPMTQIQLRCDDGRVVLLPALTTSMVHELVPSAS